MDRQPEQNMTGREAGLTRRKVLRYALSGLGIAAGAGAAAMYLKRAADPVAADVLEVFRNDAPTGQLWEDWKRRGWVAPVRYYLKLGRNVQCKTCPHECILSPGDRGRCRNRVNVDGTLYTLAYGNPCAYNLDPIEKKPLYHFLPGTRIFSLSTTGCAFRCLNCQNWDTSQRKPEELKDPRGQDVRASVQILRRIFSGEGELGERMSMFPEDVVAIAEELRSPSIACTYTEPTAYFEYALDIARAARARRLRNVWVTCGYTASRPLEELCQYLDAANVDLKSFSEQTYRKLNQGKLQPILDTLRTMKRLGVWVEVSYLVVPTYADDMDGIRRMCRWIMDNMGPDHPLHFLRFHPAHRLTQLPPTPLETMQEARQIAIQTGLRYVYLGNVRQVAGCDTTVCPGCGAKVIEREIWIVRENRLKDGRCGSCGTRIAGVWA